jgi:hypothetical protein
LSLEVLESLLRSDKAAMTALEAVRTAGPEGAYIAAGFIRNRYWDSLYDPQPQFPEADVDVIYFDATYDLKTRDLAYEASLKLVMPDVDWQVRNQARMHTFGGHDPFQDTETALRHWAETATGIGVRLSPDGAFEWLTAFGFDDLFAHILRITPVMKDNDPEGFEARLQAKGWLKRWPNLKVVRD